jgi:hypothetical protein
MNWQDLLINLALALVVLLPITYSGATALYDWLVSKLPKNAQALLATHEAQIHAEIKTAVDAIEQTMWKAPPAARKQKAMELAGQLIAALPIPEKYKPIAAKVDALIEQMVGQLPDTFTHDDSSATPIFQDTVKPGNVSNPFLDTKPQILNPLPPVTAPMPTVNSVDYSVSATQQYPTYNSTVTSTNSAVPLADPSTGAL